MLTARDVARRLGVHENTVRRWVKQGRLRARRLPVSGFSRFEETDVQAFLADGGQWHGAADAAQARGVQAAEVLEQDSRTLGVDIAVTFAHWERVARSRRLAERIAAYNDRVRNRLVVGQDGIEPTCEDFPELTGTALRKIRAAELFR